MAGDAKIMNLLIFYFFLALLVAYTLYHIVRFEKEKRKWRSN